MRYASLGSGSRGNACVIESGGTRLLLDCGFSVREVDRRLARLGLRGEDIGAILITHEHSDHLSGAARLSRRYRLPVWLTAGTLAACRDTGFYRIEQFHAHDVFAVGDIQLHPFPVPHDAREPAQFVFSDGDVRLGQLTDTGSITPHIERMLAGVDALVLECNYEPELLRRGPYPPALKARVGGNYGHLGNDQAAALLARLDTSRLRWLIGAHVSEKNNTPSHARAALIAGLGDDTERIAVAAQDEGSGWRSL
ncbi:MBL fold metallo-hydrolase [Acidihalobacter ferrooxydans]|uniref:MBL fold metallo-hydrolase n=1 Tax=Acidihalobacter ferrooxydans TaxID=1765967 RepID=A0A1P8ULJ4_9GAMM|nr:MBL fold metallo-hydrolase [Acidihalobacter ferrooxydans]APZ44710.1 MBL fold metallo-hydrolase [Acidihalobacter ferrooxydans]